MRCYFGLVAVPAMVGRSDMGGGAVCAAVIGGDGLLVMGDGV